MLAHFKKVCKKLFLRNENENDDSTKTQEELTKSNEESTKNLDESIPHSDIAKMNTSNETNTMVEPVEFSDESETPIHELTECERNFMNEQEVETIPSTTVDSVISNTSNSLDLHLASDQLVGTGNDETAQDEKNNTGNCRVPKIKIVNQCSVETIEDTPTNVSDKLIKRVKLSKNMIRTSLIEPSVSPIVQNDGHHFSSLTAQSRDIIQSPNHSFQPQTLDVSPTTEDLSRISIPLQHVPESIFSSDTELPHVNESHVFPEEIETGSLNIDSSNIVTFPFNDDDDLLHRKNTEMVSIFSLDTELPPVNEGYVFPEEIDSLNVNTPNTLSRSKNTKSKKKNLKNQKTNLKRKRKTDFDYGRSVSNIVRGNISARKNNRSNNSIKSVKLSKNIIRPTQIRPSAAFGKEQLAEMPSSSLVPSLDCMLCGESLDSKYDLKIHLQNHYHSSSSSAALNCPPPSSSSVKSQNSGHKSNASKRTPQEQVKSQSNSSRMNTSKARSNFSRSRVESLTHGHRTPSLAMSEVQKRIRREIHGHPTTIPYTQLSNNPGTANEPPNKPRTCLVCRRTFAHNGMFLVHLQAHMTSTSNSESPFLVRVTPKAFVVKVIQKTYEKVNGIRREAISITEKRVPIKIVPSEGHEPASDSILSFSFTSEEPMKEALNKAKSQAVSEMTSPNTSRKTVSNQVKKKAQNDSVGRPTTHTRIPIISSFADAIATQSLPANKNACPTRRSPRHNNNPYSSYCMDGYSSKSSFAKSNRNEGIDASSSTPYPFDRTEGSNFSKRLATASIDAMPTTSTTVSRNREIYEESTPNTSLSPSNKKKKYYDLYTTSKRTSIGHGLFNRTTSSHTVPSTSKKYVNYGDLNITSSTSVPSTPRKDSNHADSNIAPSSRSIPSTSTRDINYEDSNMTPSSSSVPSTSTQDINYEDTRMKVTSACGKDIINYNESSTLTSSAVISSTSKGVDKSSTIKYPNSSSGPYRNRYVHIPSPKHDRLPRNQALPEQLGRYRCINCGKSYNSVDDFNAHSMLHPEEYASCDSCETRYRGRVRPEWYHGRKLCPECSDVPRSRRPEPKRSKGEHSLLRRPEEENQYKFVCSYCGRKFVQLREFKKHMNQHLK